MKKNVKVIVGGIQATISPEAYFNKNVDYVFKSTTRENYKQLMEQIENGTAVYTPQDDSLATFTGKITAEQEKIDWNLPSTQLINLVRALNPSPVAWTTWNGKRLKIYALRPCDTQFDGVPGQVVECGKKTLAVMCGDGKAVFVTELQAENSKRLEIVPFLNGKKIPVGTILGE